MPCGPRDLGRIHHATEGPVGVLQTFIIMEVADLHDTEIPSTELYNSIRAVRLPLGHKWFAITMAYGLATSKLADKINDFSR